MVKRARCNTGLSNIMNLSVKFITIIRYVLAENKFMAIVTRNFCKYFAEQPYTVFKNFEYVSNL